MTNGYLYVVNKQKFINEAIISGQSIRQYSILPIAIVCTRELATQEVNVFFDEVIINDELNNHLYLSKIIGMQNSPFENTVFLDSDTFVCSDISNLFELSNLVDIATTIESKLHTAVLPNIDYKNIIPEFNSGVIFFRKNAITEKLFNDWLQVCIELNIKIDMPGLREAILKNFNEIKFVILPEEYNSHGYKSMLMLNGEVKVIHERLGATWKSITPHFFSFGEGKRFAEKINKKKIKRLYIPYVGIIPYNWSPFNIVFKLKMMLGVKRVSKNR